MIEGCLELEAAAADVRHVIAEEADSGAGSDRRARLVNFLLVDEDSSGEDQGPGALAASDEIALDEQQVQTGFCGGRQGSVFADTAEESIPVFRITFHDDAGGDPPPPGSVLKVVIRQGLQAESRPRS